MNVSSVNKIDDRVTPYVVLYIKVGATVQQSTDVCDFLANVHDHPGDVCDPTVNVCDPPADVRDHPAVVCEPTADVHDHPADVCAPTANA